MEVDSLTYNEFVDIVKRRKWSFILPCGFTIVIAFAIALLLPPVYMSSAKILIEEQEIPTDFVKATVTSYAVERVHAIKQRIMSSSKLDGIVSRLKLYPELRGKQPNEQIISKMREDIKIENINVDVINQRTGRPSAATIAFALSYQSDNPEMAQQVTSLLASMFLEENLKIRKRQTTETTQFLENELGKLETELASVEMKLTGFKEKYINELPSLLQINIQTLQTIELKREGLSEELLAKKERMEDIQSQLASMPEASRELADQKRLEDLEALYANLQSQYTDAYPDVLKVKDEIADLKHKIASNSEIVNSSKSYLDNPAYVNLNNQLLNLTTDINSLNRRLEEYERKESDYRKRIETTLRIEEEYRVLVTKRDSTQRKYNDLLQKLMEAKVSSGLEEEQKGEKFTLVDAANYPEAPFKPNRKVIIILGFLAGLGVGTCAAAFREYFDQSVHDVDMLARATSFPVLGCIPEIVTKDDIARKRKRQVMVFVIILFILAGAYVAGSYFFPDAVSQIMEKISNVMPEKG